MTVRFPRNMHLAEVSFYKNFKSLMDQRTCLYISHRLGSTYLFDKCLVLNNGIIQEKGSHHELMAIKDGVYRNLYKKQKSWYEGDFEATEKIKTNPNKDPSV